MIYVFINLTTTRFVVDGTSMQPTLEAGQYVIISRVHYLLSHPQRGDVVVFHNPGNSQRYYIKRIVGLPGETVEFRQQMIYINGTLLDDTVRVNLPCEVENCQDGVWQIGSDQYFVLGDNRNHSNDSRGFGSIDRESLIGEAVIRYWPLHQLDWIR